MVETICPKCGAEIEGKGFFHEADQNGIIAMAQHGREEKTDLFGKKYTTYAQSCFLNFEEAKKIWGNILKCEKCGGYSLENHPACICLIEKLGKKDCYYCKKETDGTQHIGGRCCCSSPICMDKGLRGVVND